MNQEGLEIYGPPPGYQISVQLYIAHQEILKYHFNNNELLELITMIQQTINQEVSDKNEGKETII